MFGIGMPEMLLILAIALIVIGPKKLPDLAKSLGKALGEFKKATNELKDSIQIDSELKEVKTTFDEINKDLKDSRPAPPNATEQDSTDDAGAEKTPGGNNTEQDAEPADKLKTVFGRREDAIASDAANPEDEDQPSAGFSDPGAETRKG